jgi:hypothetical protein
MRKILMASLMAMCGSFAAHATDIVITQTVPASSPSWYDAAFYPLIDPSVGTINFVDLSLSANIGGGMSAQNASAWAGLFTLNLSGNVGLYFNDATPIASVNVNASPASQFLASNASFSASKLAGSASLDTLLSDPTSLSYFTGTGQSFLFIVGTDQSTVQTALFGPSTVNDQLGGVLTMTIDYTPLATASSSSGTSSTVPEPGTMALFGTALLGLAAAFSLRRSLPGRR